MLGFLFLFLFSSGSFWYAALYDHWFGYAYTLNISVIVQPFENLTLYLLGGPCILFRYVFKILNKCIRFASVLLNMLYIYLFFITKTCCCAKTMYSISIMRIKPLCVHSILINFSVKGIKISDENLRTQMAVAMRGKHRWIIKLHIWAIMSIRLEMYWSRRIHNIFAIFASEVFCFCLFIIPHQMKRFPA